MAAILCLQMAAASLPLLNLCVGRDGTVELEVAFHLCCDTGNIAAESSTIHDGGGAFDNCDKCLDIPLRAAFIAKSAPDAPSKYVSNNLYLSPIVSIHESTGQNPVFIPFPETQIRSQSKTRVTVLRC